MTGFVTAKQSDLGSATAFETATSSVFVMATASDFVKQSVIATESVFAFG